MELNGSKVLAGLDDKNYNMYETVINQENVM